MADQQMPRVALVAGVTGLVGRELAKTLLLKSEWAVIYGIARSNQDGDDDDDDDDDAGDVTDHSYRFVKCDLLDREDTLRKVSPLAGQVTHLFWVTWASQFPMDTPECCRLNRVMLSNALDALLDLPHRPASLKHVALQTGTSHYVSLRSSSSSNSHVHYDEESPRVLVEGGEHNFYYTLEDLLEERLRLAGRRIGWSVHRPGLLLGASKRSHFNFIGSLCVYATICCHLGLPFTFYGDRRCWEQPYLDASDARLVADQLVWWASSSPDLHNHGDEMDVTVPREGWHLGVGQAFNAVNRTTFTWEKIWPALASSFGFSFSGAGDHLVTMAFSDQLTYTELMAEKESVWEEVVRKHRLRPTRMAELANWEFLDTVFRFPASMLVNQEKAHRLGFTTVHGADATTSILYWVERMREERLVP